jgi:hypothetical protein
MRIMPKLKVYLVYHKIRCGGCGLICSVLVDETKAATPEMTSDELAVGRGTCSIRKPNGTASDFTASGSLPMSQDSLTASNIQMKHYDKALHHRTFQNHTAHVK